MAQEAFVFELHRRLDQRRRRLVERRVDAVFLILGERHAQSPPISIAHPTRKIDAIEQRWLREQQPNRCEHRNRSSESNNADAQQRPRRLHDHAAQNQRGSATVILPPTPCAFTPRSYIASANGGGTVNSPRFVDLISYLISSASGGAVR